MSRLPTPLAVMPAATPDVLAQMDLDGDGVVDETEMAVAAATMKKDKKTVKLLARAIIGLTVLFLVLCAMVIAAGIVANEVTKEVKTDQTGDESKWSGMAALTTTGGTPVATVNTYQMVNHDSLEYLIDAPIKVLEETTHVSHTVDSDTFHFKVLGFTQLRSEDTVHLFLAHDLVMTIKRNESPLIHKHHQDNLDQYLGRAFATDAHPTLNSKFVSLSLGPGNVQTTSGGTGFFEFTYLDTVTSLAFRVSGNTVHAILINGQQYGGNGGSLSETRTFNSLDDISSIDVYSGGGTVIGVAVSFVGGIPELAVGWGPDEDYTGYYGYGTMNHPINSISGWYGDTLQSLYIDYKPRGGGPGDLGGSPSRGPGP